MERVHRIQTPRLTLRSWRPTDAPQLRAVIDASDAHLRRFIPFMRHEPRTLEQTTEWLQGIEQSFLSDEHYRFAVLANASGKPEPDLVGEAMLIDRSGAKQWELGYWLHVDQTGHGYATEASAAVVQLAFEHHQVTKLDLQCEPDNSGSIRLALRLGFEHIETQVGGSVNNAGTTCDLQVWRLMRELYPTTDSARLSLQLFGASGDSIER